MTAVPTLDLRQAIINRVQKMPDNELAHMIDESINGDERALPGLGVLFEMIWNQANDHDREHMSQLLHEQLQHTAPHPT